MTTTRCSEVFNGLQCIREWGHSGAHQTGWGTTPETPAQPPPPRPAIVDDRCPEEQDGWRCILPVGHTEPHRTGWERPTGKAPSGRWRKTTWAIVIWSILVGLNAGIVILNAGSARTTATVLVLALMFNFIIWLIGFVPLSIIWFMTKPKGAADELARLQAARDGGILTDDEYRAKAADLGRRSE
jgi:hypothetical protein